MHKEIAHSLQFNVMMCLSSLSNAMNHHLMQFMTCFAYAQSMIDDDLVANLFDEKERFLKKKSGVFLSFESQIINKLIRTRFKWAWLQLLWINTALMLRTLGMKRKPALPSPSSSLFKCQLMLQPKRKINTFCFAHFLIKFECLFLCSIELNSLFHLLKLIKRYLNGFANDGFNDRNETEKKMHPTWMIRFTEKCGASVIQLWRVNGLFFFYTHTDMQHVLACLAANAFWWVCVRALLTK